MDLKEASNQRYSDLNDQLRENKKIRKLLKQEKRELMHEIKH